MDSSEHIEHEDDFKIKGAATRKDHREHTELARQDACTICLEPISERAVAVPCNHLTFDFLCLVSWLQEQQRCPLCKVEVTEVHYDWRSPDDYKTYHVPQAEVARRSAHSQQRHNQRQPFPGRRRPARSHVEQSAAAAGVDASLDRRRHIYRNRLFSLRVGVNRISQYRDFTTRDFASSAELQSRARTFLRRELQVFAFLDANPRGGNRDFLLEYIVAVLKTNELRGADGRAEELLKDYLGLDNTRQVLHELEAWLRSPYNTLRDWDSHVQYAESSRSTDKT